MGNPSPDGPSLRQGLVRGSVWTGVHVVLSLPVAFLVNLVVARVLGPVDYGRLGMLTLTIALASAAVSMGIGSGLMQFGAKHYARGDSAALAGLVSGVQGYALFVSAPVVAVVIMLVVDIGPAIMTLALLFGVLLPSALQMGPAGLGLMQRTDRAAQIAIVTNLATQLVVVTTAVLLRTAESIWVARIVVTGSMMLLPFSALPRMLRRAAARPKPPWRLPREFWTFAIPVGFAGLIGALATDRVQIFFLQWWSDPVSVGVFALAFGLAANVLSPVQVMVGPMLPAFSALAEQGPEAARDGLIRTTRTVAAVAGTFVSFGVPLLAGLVPVLYGNEFAPAAPLLVVLAASAAVVLAGSPSYASLMARLRGRTFLVINLAALTGMAVVAIVSIPPWGAWGGVASAVTGGLIRTLSMVALEARHHRVGLGRISRSGAAVAWAFLSTVATWFLVEAGTAGAPEPFRAIAGGAMSLMGYLVLLHTTKTGLWAEDAQAVAASLPGPVKRLGSMALRMVVTRRP